MLFQVHWQNQGDPTETMLLAQNEFFEGQHEMADVNKWAVETFERRKAECPEGWIPMICNEEYEGFWWDHGGKIGPNSKHVTERLAEIRVEQAGPGPTQDQVWEAVKSQVCKAEQKERGDEGE